MTYANQICRKCGETGQGNVEYDGDANKWMFHCWLCGMETEIENKLIPPDLQAQKGRYCEHCLKSSGGVAQGHFPRYNARGE